MPGSMRGVLDLEGFNTRGHGLVYWFLDLFSCGHRFYAPAVGRVGSMHTIAAWSWRLRTIRMAILEYFLLCRVSLFMDIS